MPGFLVDSPNDYATVDAAAMANTLIANGLTRISAMNPVDRALNADRVTPSKKVKVGHRGPSYTNPRQGRSTRAPPTPLRTGNVVLPH